MLQLAKTDIWANMDGFKSHAFSPLRARLSPPLGLELANFTGYTPDQI